MIQSKVLSHWSRRLIALAILVVIVGGVWATIAFLPHHTIKPKVARHGSTEPIITKHRDFYKPSLAEATPFVYQGKLYFFVSYKGSDFHLELWDLLKNQHLTDFGQDMNYASEFDRNGTYYFFGTKSAGVTGKSQIRLITTTDFKTFTDPIVVYTANGKQGLFNTDVTYNPDTGEYVIALEVSEAGLTNFAFHFLTSHDLVHWSVLPEVFTGKQINTLNYYVAAPTIRYIDGYYYLLYLAEASINPSTSAGTKYVTRITRSKDLKSWQLGNRDFLVPAAKEGINNSDADITDYKGKSYIMYAIGNQSITFYGLTYATANVSMKKLFVSYF